ncbi:hypothetical protein [Solirubrobacter soli]|uniref:hypothetical protein n=1 Tax=Solirubrobacter soli TaxID=363832 RepID=UPI0003F694B9|nr:hypothetical protein [Solirubrobacter soli]
MRPLLALLFVLVLAAPAQAAGPEVGIADDRVLLAGGPEADAAIAEWQQLGIQQVRIYALWSRIGGPSAQAPYEWDQLDHAVDRVVAAGMQPLLTITGPGPLWSSRRSERGDPRWDPDPALFADFAGAVAARYGDRVDRYVVWNEPNLGSWLRPQASCSHHVCTPISPHLYRGLVRAAYPAIHAADPGAQVLIGAMSSRGSTLNSENSTLRPMAFLRALGCVDARFKTLRSGRCAGFRPAKGDGFAFHPHGVLTAPDKAFPNPDDVSLASLGRLESALDRIQRGGGLQAGTRRFDLYIDEYGYQTNPPDRVSGISATTQNAWLQRAAYQAWRDPRVKLFTQYLWRDEPLASGYSGWQSGLRYADGRAKPALKSFPTPFVLDAARGRLWGQVRRRDTNVVKVERRLAGSSTWRVVATRRTDSRGYWSWTTRLLRGASYRYVAANATSAALKRG